MLSNELAHLCNFAINFQMFCIMFAIFYQIVHWHYYVNIIPIIYFCIIYFTFTINKWSPIFICFKSTIYLLIKKVFTIIHDRRLLLLEDIILNATFYHLHFQKTIQKVFLLLEKVNHLSNLNICFGHMFLDLIESYNWNIKFCIRYYKSSYTCISKIDDHVKIKLTS